MSIILCKLHDTDDFEFILTKAGKTSSPQDIYSILGNLRMGGY